MPADQQSVLPGVPGVPWWGAILIAAGITAVGATIDALTNSSLGVIYNASYLIGCVVAVLAVRRRALFTAAVQPPLITLTIGLISLYGLVLANSDASKPQGMRSAVLNVALPFSNLFPWILGTFLITLLIAAVRWYLTRGAVAAARRPARTGAGSRARAGAAKNGGTKTAAAKTRAAKAGGATAGSGKKTGSRKSGSSKPGAAKAGRKPDAPKSGTAESGTAQSGGTPTGRPPRTRRSAASPGGAQGEPTRATPAARRPRPADPRPEGEAAPPRRAPAPSRSPEPPMPETAAEPPERSGARPVRRQQSAVGNAQARPVRRAQPQVIPPRPRPTAGEQLRNKGAVEDLAGGLDD